MPADVDSLLMYGTVLDFLPKEEKKDIKNIDIHSFKKKYPITEDYIYRLEKDDLYTWVEDLDVR